MKPVIIGLAVSSPSIHASLQTLAGPRDIVITVSYSGTNSGAALLA